MLTPYKKDSIDRRTLINLRAEYSKRRSAKPQSLPVLGSLIGDINKYLYITLAIDEPTVAPTFVIINDPDFDIGTSSNEIQTKSDENMMDNWSISQESYDSISTSFEH